MDESIYTLWREVVAWTLEHKATDIYIHKGNIYLKVDTQVIPYPGTQPRSLEEGEAMLTSCLTTQYHRDRLEKEEGGTDFAIEIDGHRFRGTIARESRGLMGVFRPLPTRSYTPEEIDISDRILELTRLSHQGLILVTGKTGSGKSSTLCTLIDHINENFRRAIITLEDPIEYQFKNKKSIIFQREIGRDTSSFATGVRQAMRQAPDVILVGEIRDAETAVAAIQAAESGHVVFSTLHTENASGTISRLVEISPPERQKEIRSLLASHLKFVIGQRLIPKIGGGMVAGREIFINTPAAANMIKSGNDRALDSVMTTNRELGMVDWSTSLNALYTGGFIEQEDRDTLSKNFIGT